MNALILLLAIIATDPATNTRDVRPSGGDDAARIQSALDALPSGGTLRLAAGEYQLDTTVILRQPVVLRGDIAAVLWRPTLGFLLRAEASHVRITGVTFLRKDNGGQQVLDRSIPSDAAKHLSDWRFEDCTFAGVALAVENCDRRDLHGNFPRVGSDIDSDVQIVGCVFRDSALPYGLSLQGVEQVTVDRCAFFGISGDTIKCAAGTRYVQIVNNNIQAGRDGVSLFDASRCSVVGNYIHDCGYKGVMSKTGAAVVNRVERHIVSHNRIERCASTGIDLSVDHCTISGNQIDRCNSGIRQFRVNGSIVMGNTITACVQYELSIVGTNTVVAANSVE